MKMFISEYSLAVLYVIVVVSVIGIMMYIVNDRDDGVVITYNTNMVYANEFFAGTDLAGSVSLAEHEASGMLDSIDGVSNIAVRLHKPSFVVDSSVVNDDYIISVPLSVSSSTKTHYTYDEILNLFSANGKISLNVWDGSGYVDVGLPSDVEVVVVKLSPVTRGTDGSLLTEVVESRDKYGNIIYNSDGSPATVERVVYNEEVFSRNNIDEFYIDWDVACRYKVLFRYTDDSLKSEYSAMFANKIRSATEIYKEVYTEWVY